MPHNYIYTLQKLAVSLIQSSKQKPLWMRARWNCSEVARIVGLKVLRDRKNSRPVILKGRVTATGLTKENKHDILLYYEPVQAKFFLLDPTVWQFFPRKRIIMLGLFNSQKEARDYAYKIYGGRFKVSEHVNLSIRKEVKKWKKVLRDNAEAAPYW